jgi:carboxylesterase type B
MDVPYTFYNGPDPAEVISPQIAMALQEYITNFAEKGTPNGPGVPHFQMYGPHATVQDLNITGISELMDPAANYRCDWWQKALYQ